MNTTTEDRILRLRREIGDAAPEAIASYLLAEDLADGNLPGDIERAAIEYAEAAREQVTAS